MLITESVDSLGRDGPDMSYVNGLSDKLLTFVITISTKF